VTDSTGAVVQNATVKVRNVATNFEVTAETRNNGSFRVADLPIGTYEVSFSKQAFQTSVFPQIIVQGNRTATVNAQLKPGHASESVTVNATPLLNQTDTTTGYTLDDQQIAEIPLATGSFTRRRSSARGLARIS
jgi:Carboxypeptidase regulatory-like domain